jgi:hypothetical protein
LFTTSDAEMRLYFFPPPVVPHDGGLFSKQLRGQGDDLVLRREPDLSLTRAEEETCMRLAERLTTSMPSPALAGEPVRLAKGMRERRLMQS